ncbi:ubiquitin related modifier 1 [Pelomyxa schiedti]|nr:ubiquitin related modifier 1 [Pelomyxa schiedti]
MRVQVEFGGGLEIVSGIKQDSVDVGDGVTNVGGLITWLVANRLSHCVNQLILNNSLRPGIIVVINDDYEWGLYGKEACPLSDGDSVAFITTLHGG